MKKKTLIIIAGLSLAAIFIAALLLINNSASEQSNSNNIYSFEDVASHNKMDDCWTIINDGVYNITNYVPIHPGGNEILLTCGVDGTSLFTERTDTNGQPVGSGEPHSDTAEKQLASYKIGTLNN